MAFSNIHETLLMYTKQKALINSKLSSNMMDLYNASKNIAEEQSKYNNTLDDIYFTYYDEDMETYELLSERAEQEHELKLANINAWEDQLELEKNNLETQLNEILQFESTWTKLLQQNVKSDFTYGSISQ